MTIRIVLFWRSNESVEGGQIRVLVKYVEMPAIPPVGTSLYIDRPIGVIGPHVEHVHWEEEDPDVFSVETDVIKVDYTEDQFTEAMDKLGWHSDIYY